jgi:ribonuclease BN (tRNA processing enzyme)
MKITIVGCGNAFSDKNFNQSFLLEEGNQKLLIDCGTRVPMALRYLGIDINSITDVYCSHQHSDHSGGLEELAFLRYDWAGSPTTYDDSRRSKDYAPNLICNELLMKDLWEHTLKGGLESMQGFDSSLETFFRPIPIKANQILYWEGWMISLVQQIHIMTGSVFKNTFGLFIEHSSNPSKQKVFFTTDAQYFQPEQVKVFYDKADLIFQDCECIGCDTINKKMLFKSGVHANYGQLAGWENVNAMRLDEKTKKKLWLSHYQDFVTECKDGFGNACDWDKLAEEDGFAGFVTVGQEFIIK